MFCRKHHIGRAAHCCAETSHVSFGCSNRQKSVDSVGICTAFRQSATARGTVDELSDGTLCHTWYTGVVFRPCGLWRDFADALSVRIFCYTFHTGKTFLQL